MVAENPRVFTIDEAGRRIVAANLVVAGAVLMAMMLLGLTMRLGQSGWLEVPPARFYQIMTVHGTGMIGIAALGGITVMWYFLSQYVRLSTHILTANLLLFLIGVVIILTADFIGGFAAGWTILFPLPTHGAVWPAEAAFWHLLGLMLVGAGLLLVALDFGRALIARYGSLGRSHGWPQLFGLSNDPLPPPTVIAGTMVTIVTTLTVIGGASIMVPMMINALNPAFTINPLLAKNVIYFFGHSLANVTIYMAVVVIYELLPLFAGRPYKASRIFVAGWTGSTIMVLIIFPHHLFMDFAMPQWASGMAQVLSFTNSFPAMLVTGFGALALVHRSGIQWSLVSGLLFLSLFGWLAGIVPAVIDATIVVNSVMHNTLWVPGHFHFYMLLGVIPMILAFMLYLTRDRLGRSPEKDSDMWALIVYLGAGLGFVLVFLYSGRHSVPRRWAVHWPEWMVYDRFASVFAALVILAAAFFIVRFLIGLRHFLSGR